MVLHRVTFHWMKMVGWVEGDCDCEWLLRRRVNTAGPETLSAVSLLISVCRIRSIRMGSWLAESGTRKTFLLDSSILAAEARAK